MEALTRRQHRERVRHALGKRTGRDEGSTILFGEPSSTHPWPTNLLIDEKLDDAVKRINRFCDLGFVQSITIEVSATTENGAQRIVLRTFGVPSLDGISGYPGDINNIKRASFTLAEDATPQPLTPVVREDYDLTRRLWESDAPGTPRHYWQDGSELYLLPGTDSDITLTLMAGTGVIGFSADSDVLLQIPNDYHPIFSDLAAGLVAETRMQDTEMRDYAAIILGKVWGTQKDPGSIADIMRWKALNTVEAQKRIIPRTGRVYSGRRG